MAKKKTEEVVEKATEDNVVKVDLKNKKEDGNIAKVNLDKPPKPEENEIKEDNPIDEGVVAEPDNAEPTEKQEEVQSEEQAQETPVLEEVTEEEVKEQVEDLAEQAQEAMIESAETGKEIPENIQKLIDFMEDTGGTLEDYVTLNQDFSSYDDMTVLREYYKKTKSHLTPEEVEFLIDDNFSYDEEVDEEREVKKKKIALKEQVADAKAHLDRQKSKYYEEIKAGSKLTNEQQKAVNFFNRYNEESKESKAVLEKQANTFKMKTNNVFNKDFKGFDYNVGDKKYRFNVKDTSKIKENQSDINNFVKRFLNENNEMSDAKGYHKSLFTANNPDAIAKHFYEQGKADALKTSVAKAKNVDMNPRQQHGVVEAGGMKVKVLGQSSNDFKFKIKNK